MMRLQLDQLRPFDKRRAGLTNGFRFVQAKKSDGLNRLGILVLFSHRTTAPVRYHQ